ncbi:hypothetical protein [Jannaschia formosa]|uniref:hypothetical protein n=1 Tax=Jannaschia formosa TaxID=2259592 RepID=UPI000E1BA988|nr:hypothetical protein [Jannaschia formosa]TFL19001.1 hypothetical protein DR046_06200 [Jannaschia formosa]
MLSLVSLVLGLAMLAILFVDFLLTTIGAVTRPVLAGRLAARIAAGMRWLYRRAEGTRMGGTIQAVAGTVVMTGVGTFWVVGFSFGWTLVYLSGSPSIRLQGPPEGQAPVFWDHWSHVGHLLSTLGGATTAPASTMWSATGVVVGIMGMVVLTLSVSFLLSTTQTVVKGRSMARLVRLGVEVEPADVSDLIESLRSSPFAAYFSHGHDIVGMPDMLYEMARRRLAEGEGATLRAMLSDLPGFDAPHEEAPDAVFLAALSDWCGGFMLTPPPT